MAARCVRVQVYDAFLVVSLTFENDTFTRSERISQKIKKYFI